MLSKPIDFEKLLNTRDLGGMTAAGGRKIKQGKLYRSGHLFTASENDLKKLSGMIDMSIDFRTAQECSEKPEPSIEGVLYFYNPIFQEQQAGVTRDDNSFAMVLKNMMYDAEIARRHMCGSYEGFITNAYSVGQYRQFVRLLLKEHEKGVLWHCTAGKDRAGFGTIIVQELLGVGHEDIVNDYLQTNICLKPETIRLKDWVLKKTPDADPEIGSKAISFVFEAHMDYLNTVYDTIQKHYGNFDSYISEALKITPEEKQQFREMYLE